MANKSTAAAGGTLRETFTAFFEGWQARQVTFLQKLEALIPETGGGEDSNKAENCMHLVEQVLGHYREYYYEKLKAANEDIFLVFSPPWFSSFERTLFWLCGFKPSLIFQLVSRTIDDLSAEQVERIELVRVEIKNKEREIGEVMAKVQESVASPTFLELARQGGRLVDGEVGELDAEMDKLKGEMLMVMGRADELRGTAGMEVLEILSPKQKVKLLAGKAQFWIQARRFGMEKDAREEISLRFY